MPGAISEERIMCMWRRVWILCWRWVLHGCIEINRRRMMRRWRREWGILGDRGRCGVGCKGGKAGREGEQYHGARRYSYYIPKPQASSLRPLRVYIDNLQNVIPTLQ